MDWNGASIEPLLKSRRRIRRPITFNRTGRRGRWNALVADSSTLVGPSLDFSTRHTQVLREAGGEPIAVLNRLLNTLQESDIPGPQLFRLQNEFSEPLGQGGQGNVRGLNPDAAKRYQAAHKSIRKTWPAECIAIKQHMERKDNYVAPVHKTRFDKNNLSWRFRAAECEVLALAPGLFHNHPNIVKLIGWGLCLDTAENPLSPCCSGLQLPLLIFERAEMNLAQFLQKIFAASQDNRSDEVSLEEGRGVPNQTRHPLSLLGRIWLYFRCWVRTKQDVYALVRLLCIDVGRGLQSLHENFFTHGDLKPDNILVFRERSGWIAKLCDFGCALGYDNNASSVSDNIKNDVDTDTKQKCKRGGPTYLGTPGWQPSDREVEAIRGFDEQRRCDLYVYGLLVWSSFCREGKHHPGHPLLQDMLEAVEQLTAPGKDRLSSAACKQWIASQVTQVLKDTMRAPKQRSLEPWTLFGRRSRRRREREESFVQNLKRAADAEIQESQDKGFQLSLEMKETYNKLEWWLGYDQALWQSSGHSSDDGYSGKDNTKSGPASSNPIDSDNNCLSTETFHTKRRMDDLEDLFSRIASVVQKLKKMNGKDHSYRQELYHLARFRSRVPIEWWRSYYVERDEILQHSGNILQEVLQGVPSVDMHTLAWLCAGPIGRIEVMRLNNHHTTWASVMEPSVLDESERLDRFLLLLQFGAPVASQSTKYSYRFQGSSVRENKDLHTIFMQFIETCRPAVVVVALQQIFERVERADYEGFISVRTAQYFRRLRYGSGYGGLLQRISLLKDPGLLGNPSEVRETAAMNRLPEGWTAIKAKEKCYRDKLTQSVTLTEPEVSLLHLRQLEVGFLQQQGEDGTLCHVDLLACMRVGSGPEADVELAQDLEHRFPYYDEAWYMAEWNSKPVVVDVLKSLKDRWRIRTFTSRLRAPEINVGKAIKAIRYIFWGRF